MLGAVALLAATLVLLLSGVFVDRSPPAFDDDQQRDRTAATYQSIHDNLEQHRADADRRLDEGRDRVTDTGEIGISEVELDELLDR